MYEKEMGENENSNEIKMSKDKINEYADTILKLADELESYITYNQQLFFTYILEVYIMSVLVLFTVILNLTMNSSIQLIVGIAIFIIAGVLLYFIANMYDYIGFSRELLYLKNIKMGILFSKSIGKVTIEEVENGIKTIMDIYKATILSDTKRYMFMKYRRKLKRQDTKLYEEMKDFYEKFS